MIRTLLSSLVVISLLLSASAGEAQSAGPTAQLPTYQTGEEWIYSVTANGYPMGQRRYRVEGEATFRGQPALRVTSRIVEGSPERARTFTQDSDLFLTPELVWLGRQREKSSAEYTEPPVPMFHWPMEVGQKWSDTISFYLEDADFPQTQTRFQVLGYESVDVPAGTFEAYHLKFRGYHPEFPGNATVIDYWYAPAVKSIVKYQGILWFENVDFHLELVRYKLKE